MRTFSSTIFLALTALPSIAHADLDVDAADIPATCQGICRPILELSSTCDVSKSAVGGEAAELQGEKQCYCNNTSFEVGRITALCQSCASQNAVSIKNLREINDIMAMCAFATASFTPADATAADGIVVTAAAPVGQDTSVPGTGGGKKNKAAGKKAAAAPPPPPNAQPAPLPRVFNDVPSAHKTRQGKIWGRKASPELQTTSKGRGNDKSKSPGTPRPSSSQGGPGPRVDERPAAGRETAKRSMMSGREASAAAAPMAPPEDRKVHEDTEGLSARGKKGKNPSSGSKAKSQNAPNQGTKGGVPPEGKGQGTGQSGRKSNVAAPPPPPNVLPASNQGPNGDAPVERKGQGTGRKKAAGAPPPPPNAQPVPNQPRSVPTRPPAGTNKRPDRRTSGSDDSDAFNVARADGDTGSSSDDNSFIVARADGDTDNSSDDHSFIVTRADGDTGRKRASAAARGVLHDDNGNSGTTPSPGDGGVIDDRGASTARVHARHLSK